MLTTAAHFLILYVPGNGLTNTIINQRLSRMASKMTSAISLSICGCIHQGPQTHIHLFCLGIPWPDPLLARLYLPCSRLFLGSLGVRIPEGLQRLRPTFFIVSFCHLCSNRKPFFLSLTSHARFNSSSASAFLTTYLHTQLVPLYSSQEHTCQMLPKTAETYSNHTS